MIGFQAAASADPTCAMAYWGQAYARGPFFNKPWKFYGPQELRPELDAARAAIVAALARLGPRCTLVERALIQALDVRYLSPAMSSQAEFDASDDRYAEAMRSVLSLAPEDDDVIALTAEALITRTPWELWDATATAAMPGADTAEASKLLEDRLSTAAGEGRAPHPGQCHMYIHTMEMSPRPEAALEAAYALRGFAPDSGHLNHSNSTCNLPLLVMFRCVLIDCMIVITVPGHIFTLCGRYAEAIETGRLAVAADAKYIAAVPDLGFYTTACAHDWHLMMYAAMLQGSAAAADAAVDGMHSLLSVDRLDAEAPHLRATLEAYYSMSIHINVRFGRWESKSTSKPPEPVMSIA